MTHKLKLQTLSGDPLGRMCFGTMQFGTGSDPQTSQAIYDRCRKTGINHFDTAWVYTQGQSETLLGQFARSERDQVFVATKLGYTGGAGASNLQIQFDQSRQRLGMDCVDLVYLHRYDPDTPLTETLEWFANQQRLGTIRHIGLSNFAAWQIVQAHNNLRDLGSCIDAVQPMYSLVKRQAEVEIFPACAALDIACFSYSPLGAGLLSGKYVGQSGAEGRLAHDPRYARRYHLDTMHKTAADLNELAGEMGVDTASLAIAWVMHSAFAPTPIISARNLDQIMPCLQANEMLLTGDDMAKITALSPTPPPATDRLEELG